ncbi:MAG: hypothetical protein FWH27_17820 [Planctomycetaceae bacterium]|nr:hypothetical protein [Planctomycetaceae bacterium]
MSDMLAKAALWLAEKQEKFSSSGIMYVRNGEKLPLSATFGRTEYEISDEFGVKTGAHVVDFIIRANLLTFDPEPGDGIIAGDTEYEVMPLGSHKCWRWCDAHHHLRRIHTKQL